MIGIISRWGAKGYGFVKCAELETEAWLHAKFLEDPDYQPHQGDQVEFSPEKLPDGRYQARKVRLVGPSNRPRETSRSDAPPRAAYGGGSGGSSGGGFGVKLALGGFTLQPKPAAAPQVLPPEPTIDELELPPEEPTPATEEAAAPESAPSLPLRERIVEERRRREATAGQLKAAVAQVEQSIRTLTERLAKFQADAAALEAGGAAADAALVEAAVGEAAFELENGLYEQRRLRDAVEAARRLALQRNGLPPLEKYEGVRRRLREASGQDELILEAFRTLERQQRLPLRDYAEALDRLDAAEKVSARFIAFTTPDGAAQGPHPVIVVAPLKVQALASAGATDLATRIAIAFWHAAERVSRELGGGDVIVEHGVVCGSVAVRCAALDAHLFPMILEETWASRPALAELGAEPCCELVDNVAPAFESEPEPEEEEDAGDAASDEPDTSKVELAAVTGTALADVASRLGLTTHDLVMLLVLHGLPFPDDHVEAGTESTLRALLGGERTEGGEARAARADAASGEAGVVELPGPAGVASRMLKKLLTDRRVGGRHTRIEHAYGHHFSDEEKEVARRVALWLEKDGIFLPKLNEGSHHISINPRRLRDVGAIIEGTWDRRADLEAIV